MKKIIKLKKYLITHMEIYDPDKKKATEYEGEPGNEGRVFFKRSLFNDWLPAWEKVVFFAIGFVGLQILATIVSLCFMAIGDEVLYTTLVNFVSYALLVAVFVLFMAFDKRGTIKKLWSNVREFKTYLPYGLIAFLCIIGVEYIFSLLYYYTVPDIYGANSNQSTIEIMVAEYPAMMFFELVFFAPFCEEIAYRIGLVDYLGHKKRWLGVILASAIFGLVHFDISPTLYYAMYGMEEYYVEMLNEWLNLPIYMAMGFCLSFVYAKTGNIMSSMTAHACNNLLSFISLVAGASLVTGASALVL